MRRSGSAKNDLRRKIATVSVAILLTSMWLYSSGDSFYLDAIPLAVDTLPGHQVTVKLARPESTLEREVKATLESLSPEIAEVPGNILIPAGVKEVAVPVFALQAGSANIRASAESFGDIVFTVNVDGERQSQATVSPTEIRLDLQAGQSEAVHVSLTLPSGTLVDEVDIALAVDARPTFASANSQLAQAFPEIVARLKEAYPNVSFAFSVTKFQDYGGQGEVFSRLVPPPPTGALARPFVLLLPMTPVDTQENIDAIVNALSTQLPDGSPFSVFGSYLETLGQIAQGAGFDADANGSALESGPAAVAGDENTPGFLNPGASGDVPPFSSKPSNVPSAGTIGGVGFRPGAQKIVLLATNTAPVSPIDISRPFPDLITGANGVQVSSNVFQEVLTYPSPGTFQNPRWGAVSSSVSEPIPPNAVAPAGAFTVPQVFQLLAAQNIEVVSFFQLSQQSPLGGMIDPIIVLQGIARLTGALNSSGVPLTFELIGRNASDVANEIVAGIRPVLDQPRPITLRAVGNDAGFGFSYTPRQVIAGPGQTADFDVTITGTGAAGTFEIQFVANGVVLGSIPVFINGAARLQLTSLSPTSGPIATRVTVQGLGFPVNVADAQVRFGGILAQVLSITGGTTLETLVPAGSVAGPVDVTVTVGGTTSNALPFTVLHTITSLTPTSGTGGTEFTIVGSGFASGVAGNTVRFGSTPATILEATNTLIRGTVPSDIVANAYTVTVTTNGVTTTAGTFNLLPAITGIAPASAGGNAAITISGSGFSTTNSENAVTFTDVATGATAAAAVTSSAFTSIGATVPAQLVAGPYRVTVTVNGRTSGPANFTVLPAITSATPASVRIGQQITITGTGFSPNAAENVVSLNGTAVPLLAGSNAKTLLVTAFPGLTGTTLDIVVTTRGAASAPFRIQINPAPVIITQTIGGTTYPGVSGIFETRERIVITVSGADPNGDVVSASFIIRDGEGQTLGSFTDVSLGSILSNQARFVFQVPFDSANHFTAAMTAVVQLKDAAGNTSESVAGTIVNPDIRPFVSGR